ncbi:MAG: hypothetical protein GX250_00795 [Clostridiales bacterium]|jgi:hypothetical protein|nr:hypothetical protein [Clostridiales bacterium]
MEKNDKRKREKWETLDQYYDMNTVASANSYTGLTPTPPHSEEEAMSYSMLYCYPNQDFKSVLDDDDEIEGSKR